MLRKRHQSNRRKDIKSNKMKVMNNWMIDE